MNYRAGSNSVSTTWILSTYCYIESYHHKCSIDPNLNCEFWVKFWIAFPQTPNYVDIYICIGIGGTNRLVALHMRWMAIALIEIFGKQQWQPSKEFMFHRVVIVRNPNRPLANFNERSRSELNFECLPHQAPNYNDFDRKIGGKHRLALKMYLFLYVCVTAQK